MTGDSNGALKMPGVNRICDHQSNGEAVEPATMPLAIVGMACRFSGGVNGPDDLWDLVSCGRDAWSEIPSSRFNQKAFYHPVATRVSTIHEKGGYFLEEDVGAFDLSFFNMSADVATAMDPQLRMQLEVTFEALESAGIPLSKVSGSNTSVFAGAFTRDYKDVAGRDPLHVPRSFITGNYATMLANRVSHFFDLKGHSTSIDTACSTSLIGLHLACQSLRSGDSDAAIVGGASLHLSPETFSTFSTLGVCGPDGKCYAFDQRAQGYGRGEGVAALVIKRLSDAVRDGDPIRAVIRETGANQDGRTPTITSPDAEAQRRLIQQCYTRARLDPLETALVEAHGTGTPIGDPLEAKAIGETLGRHRPATKPLYMASVKTNLGHTEAASGLASIIKTAMSLEHRKIAPNLNYRTANPDIDMENLHLEIPICLQAWPSSKVRRASVNNFGFGGTNTHVIMEEARPLSEQLLNGSSVKTRYPGRQLIVLSARDKAAANKMTANLLKHLEKEADRYADDASFVDLVYTLCERRSRFLWTVTATATSVEDLAAVLADNSSKPVQNVGMPPRLGFVFNGQGAQWFGMGRELYSAYPVYAQTLQECDRILRSFGANWSLLEELARNEKTTRVNDVQFAMPLSCAVQLALVQLLNDLGVKPAAVTGHSSGEVAAAFAAGALSLREAMACTFFRGLVNAKHLAKAEDINGGMIAVGLGPADVQPYLDNIRSGQVVIACVNSPTNVTLSGDIAGIKELELLFKRENVFARALRVQAAFHSHHMLPLEDEYHAALQQHMGIHTDEQSAWHGDVLFVSPVTGKRITEASGLGPQHWVQNMTRPVLFAQSFHNTIAGETGKQQVEAIIEVGPHSALAGPIRQSLKGVPALKSMAVAYGSCLERGKDAVETIQALAGFLVERGYPVITSQVNSPCGKAGLRALSGLPSYPWNHTQRFWQESRMSVEHKGRIYPLHDLLGTRLPGTSNKAPIWRHVIRTEEVPWVRDHVVQGNIVYPGAGFITMAIEAMRQVHESSSSTISGYRLSEIDILKAAVIPEDATGIELQLFLEPAGEKTLDNGKRQFRIYSALGGSDWEEAARGFITVETDEPSPDFTALASTNNIDLNTDVPRGTLPKEMYASLHKVGVVHGPIFQNLLDIRRGKNFSAATFQVHNTAAEMPYGFQQPHVIHPVTLDQVFQASYSTLSPEAERTVGTAVPRSVKSLYISASTGSEPGLHLQVFSRLMRYSRQGFHVNAAVLPTPQQDTLNRLSVSKPVIELDGMRFQSVGGVAEIKIGSNDICAFINYEPSFSLNDPATLVERLARPVDPEEKAIGQDLLRATYHLIADAVVQISEHDKENLEWHHKKLYAWIQTQLTKAAANELAPKSSRWIKVSAGAKAMFLDRVASSGPSGALLVRVGRRLVEILRRETDPYEIMLEGGLLYAFYKEMLHFSASKAQLAEVAAAYTREHPRARILEIGGGTGGCTEPVLRALGCTSTQHAGFEHYDFTDISSVFFQAARERFAAWGDRISYSLLNIEDDAAQQGFAEKSYDLIIAALVLYATTNIEKTMRNVRKLLRDGGRLLLLETTKDWAAQHLIFGTLPGWWLSKESERATSPNLSLETWQRVLKATGFSGLDANIWDCEDKEHQASSVILSTALQQGPLAYYDKVALVYDDDIPPPREWLRSLATSIGAVTGAAPMITRLSEIDLKFKACIFVSRLDGAPYTIDAYNFGSIKSLVTSSRGILWVTSGATIDCPVPENAIPLGLLRTCRTEDASRRFISLDLDPTRPAWDSTSHAILARVFAATFDLSKDVPGDVEFTERGGKILVPRVSRDNAENASFTGTVSEPELQPFMYAENRRLKMEVDVPGQLDSIVFRDDREVGERLPDGWVEIEPHAYGLNFHDVMGATGQLDEAQELGHECAGIVSRIGSRVNSVKVGDRAAALTLHGHFASRVRVPWTSVVPIANEMSFSEAASMALVFATAYYSMFEVARLEPGETVLIHAASGGVGQACIILAQWKTLKVLATVGSPEKRAFLTKTYGISNDFIFSSRDTSFAPSVLKATNGRGVDAVINSLSGSLLHASWAILASHGRFVEIGKREIHRNMALEMETFRKAASFTAVDLVQLADHRGLVLQRVLATVVELMGGKTIRNISPVVAFPMAEIGRAIRLMQADKYVGKIVIIPEPSDMVKTFPCQNSAELRPNATYLVVGGLGGIGRSLARWLVNHGAKNLLLLSRSAASSPHAQLLQKDLAALGVNAVPRNCDIADLASLQIVLSECNNSMPPIRGIIHGGMALNDSILENMTASQWQAAMAPKVAGTRNLDRLFSTPGSLDFFINLSSVVGMTGNPSQANYGSGGAFQDAIARHRAARKLPCVTIDVGMVKSVGYVAEGDKAIAERLMATGRFRPLEETDLHQLVDYAVRVPFRSVYNAQVVTGLAGSAVRKQSIGWTRELRFAALASDDEAASVQGGAGQVNGGGSATNSLVQRLAGAQGIEEATELVEKAVVGKLADMFAMSEEDIDPAQSLSNHGIDSLVAVELRSWLVLSTKCDVSVFDLLGAKPLRDLAGEIAERTMAVGAA